MFFFKDGVHAGEFGEDGRFVDALRAFDSLVDFLKRDEVGLDGIDNVGDALKIEYAIHSDAVVDVVGQGRGG